MPKTRPPNSPEFRRQMVDLVRAGRNLADLAREFAPTAQSICHWVTQADRQQAFGDFKRFSLRRFSSVFLMVDSFIISTAYQPQ